MADKATENPGNKFEIGETILNKYLIENLIKETNKSKVFKVREKRTLLSKCVKVKIIDHSVDENQIMLELKILGKLEHPFVLKYYGAYLHNGSLYTITDYCPDGTLEEKIYRYETNSKTFSPDRILNFTSQIICACQYLHSKKVIHRNIKPATILLKNGSIKLSNFGTSRFLEKTDLASTYIGTPFYMAPEIIKNEEYNYKADIWSIGCVLYELATLRMVFTNDKNIRAHSYMMKVLEEPTPTLEDPNHSKLNVLLKKCLAKEPKERASADDLICDEIIYEFTKNEIAKSLERPKSVNNMACLVSSLSMLNKMNDN